MILNAPFISNSISFPFCSDYAVELSYATSNSSVSPDSSPSPSLSKLRLDSPNKSAVPQSKERRVFDQPCAICSNTATGYHYNVASCNGCKTFFRRCVLAKHSYRCVRADSNCLASMKPGATRIKCRSCRLDRCLEQGMRKEAVTSAILTNDPKRESSAIYISHISQPSTSTEVARVVESTATLRQTLRLINKFRRCSVVSKDIDHHIKAILAMPSFLENMDIYEDMRDTPQFKRDLPEWLTVDLLCSVEFIKKIPDLAKFADCDKEELIRSSCFTIAVAIQAIESYFDKHLRVVMPDKTDVIQTMIDSKNDDIRYKQMFVAIMDPLHREQFTIDELVLALQMLFFTIADSTNLTPEAKVQLEKSVQTSMQILMVHLVIHNRDNFSSRFGRIVALNESFVKATLLHKQKMKEGELSRKKLEDILIEECCFDYRVPN